MPDALPPRCLSHPRKLQFPFPSLVVASDDDPYCPPERARALAQAWGSDFAEIHAAGHITASSGYGEWPEGFHMLEDLVERAERDTR